MTARRISPMPMNEPADSHATARLPRRISSAKSPGMKQSITMLDTIMSRTPNPA